MNFISLLRQAASLWMSKAGDQHAAALAYFAPFALTPLLLISITIVGFIIGRDEVISLLLRWGSAIDSDLPAFMQSSLQNFQGVTESYAVPTLALIVLSMMVVFTLNSLSSSLHHIWGVRVEGWWNFFKQSGRSILFIFLIQVYLVVTIISNNIFAEVYSIYGWAIVNLIAQLLFFFCTILLITIGYWLLPLSSPGFKSRLWGAVVAASLFLFTRSLVAIHIVTMPTADIYGAAGLIFVLLIWIYVSACIIFFGAAFAQVHSQFIAAKKLVTNR